MTKRKENNLDDYIKGKYKEESQDRDENKYDKASRKKRQGKEKEERYQN